MKANHRKSKPNNEPSEEFIDNHSNRKDMPEDSAHYKQWSMKELQEEAEKKGISDSLRMNRHELIKKIIIHSKSEKKSSRH